MGAMPQPLRRGTDRVSSQPSLARPSCREHAPSKQQYEVGFETLADYLETQAQWQQCNAALVNARCQLQLTYVRLLKASGTLK